MGHFGWLWDRVLAVVNIDWDGDWADWPWTAPMPASPVNPERALIDATRVDPEASPWVDCPIWVPDIDDARFCSYCSRPWVNHSPKAQRRGEPV